MTISIIAAMDANRVIGKDNALPWRLPADLKHFKRLTMGHSLIIGRRTWENLPPLPGRAHIVISRKPGYLAPGARVAPTLEEAVEMAGNESEIFIGGGYEIFRLALPIADRMYLTHIDHEFDGDTFFPEWNANEWRAVDLKEIQPDSGNLYPCRFVTYERVTRSE